MNADRFRADAEQHRSLILRVSQMNQTAHLPFAKGQLGAATRAIA